MASKRSESLRWERQLLVVLVDDGGDRVGAGVGADHADGEAAAEAEAEPELALLVGPVPAGVVDDAGSRARSRRR